ncbi:MAG TPA: GLUG motif-containing protein [Rhizomicrobium sp.]
MIAGSGGRWLLDPYNLTVTKSAASTIDKSLNHGTSVTLKTSSSGTSGAGTATAGPGDIIVAASVNWSGNAKLTLDAFRNVQIDNGITIRNTGAGNLVLAADTSAQDSGTVMFKGTGKIDFSGSTGGVSIFYHPASYAAPISYKTYVTLQAGDAFGVYMTIDNASDLQSMQDNLTGSYTLNKNINASSISNFVPVGSNSSDTNTTRFNGVLSGRGHTISNLNISSNAGDVGLFGGLGTKAKISSLKLSAVTVSGTEAGTDVGALAGKNEGKITGVSVTGNVTGAGDALGGLVGDNGGTGTIASSSSGAIVTDNDTTGGFAYVGGLVGINYHSISNSYATNSVTETAGTTSDIGGLVGWNNGGAISGSHALGNVSTNDSGDFDDVGGLAGRSGFTGTSSITTSYASGSVSGGGYTASVGGLVGAVTQTSSVSSSHASGNVSGGGQYAFVGGLIGDVTDTTGSVTNAQASGSVIGGIDSDDGSLIGANAGTVTGSTATGSVSGGSGSCIGGLIGYPGGAGSGCL